MDYYHISWLEVALNNFKDKKNIVHAVNGDMTIGEFIEKHAKEELDKIITIKEFNI